MPDHIPLANHEPWVLPKAQAAHLLDCGVVSAKQ